MAESDEDHVRWLKRQAIHIVSQMPADIDDALAVIDHAKVLLKGFLADGRPTPRAADVIRLVPARDEA